MRLKFFSLFVCFSIVCFSSAFPNDVAKDDLIRKLSEKVDQLEKKVDALSGKLGIYENSKGVSEEVIDKKVSDALARKAQDEPGFLKALKGITLSGYVDAAYEYNFNTPSSGANTARIFDTEANSFTFQSAKIALEKLPSVEDRVGFRTDVIFGQDAKIIKSYGWDTDDVNLEQGYVDALLPLGKGLDVKFGKFVTLAGAEVIESKDNWNFSRGLLFGYAIPFTHTGIRASYPVLDNLTGYFGINNGWDDIKDNNSSKTIETALAYAPTDKVSFNLAYLFGPEYEDNNHSNRNLIDFIATYKPLEKLTFKVNTDYGFEDGLNGVYGVTGKDSGDWFGVAGYVRYDVNNWLSFSNRTEYFSDPDGLRNVGGLSTALGQDVWENTLTMELRPFKNIITRLEYRYDQSSENIFTKNDAEAAGHQSTIGFETIYAF
ncbi:MAG: porin [Candidatus Omnitrophota bacterium]|jgi:hypothetical protein